MACSQSVLWASVNDCSRAAECIDRALSLGVEYAWALSCKSEALGLEDRWEDALAAADQAWDLIPGAPHAAYCLRNTFLHLGQVGDSSRRLALAAESGESFEVAELAAGHLCTLAETLEGEVKRQILDRAQAILESMPKLAPLMDREAKSRIARLKLDIAEQSDDQEGVQHWAQEIRSLFFRQVFENLKKTPRGARLRLPFRRVTQHQDTCLPTSIAAILPSLGLDFEPEEIARDLTYAGTPHWVAAEWLENRGIVVRMFTVSPLV